MVGEIAHGDDYKIKLLQITIFIITKNQLRLGASCNIGFYITYICVDLIGQSIRRVGQRKSLTDNSLEKSKFVKPTHHPQVF